MPEQLFVRLEAVVETLNQKLDFLLEENRRLEQALRETEDRLENAGKDREQWEEEKSVLENHIEELVAIKTQSLKWGVEKSRIREKAASLLKKMEDLDFA